MDFVAFLSRPHGIPCRTAKPLTRSTAPNASLDVGGLAMSQDRFALDQLVQMTRSSAISRRGFLRGASLAGLAVGAPGLLAACGTPAAKQTAASCVSKDLSATQ